MVRCFHCNTFIAEVANHEPEEVAFSVCDACAARADSDMRADDEGFLPIVHRDEIITTADRRHDMGQRADEYKHDTLFPAP